MPTSKMKRGLLGQKVLVWTVQALENKRFSEVAVWDFEAKATIEAFYFIKCANIYIFAKHSTC